MTDIFLANFTWCSGVWFVLFLVAAAKETEPRSVELFGICFATAVMGAVSAVICTGLYWAVGLMMGIGQ